jgi:uncharacterized protein YndB with AHSA1/START domain
VHSSVRVILAAGLVLAPAWADAEVVSADSAGFQVKSVFAIAVPPSRVYAAFSQIGSWWDMEHSYSHKGVNLTLSARAGGCFCEKLDNGGSVQHMMVILAIPGHELRMRGSLGPLQTEAATGVLVLSLAPKDQGTELTEIYSVAGWTKGGWADWGPAVDGVLNGQFTRLKSYVETGKAIP